MNHRLIAVVISACAALGCEAESLVHAEGSGWPLVVAGGLFWEQATLAASMSRMGEVVAGSAELRLRLGRGVEGSLEPPASFRGTADRIVVDDTDGTEIWVYSDVRWVRDPNAPEWAQRTVADRLLVFQRPYGSEIPPAAPLMPALFPQQALAALRLVEPCTDPDDTVTFLIFLDPQYESLPLGGPTHPITGVRGSNPHPMWTDTSGGQNQSSFFVLSPNCF